MNTPLVYGMTTGEEVTAQSIQDGIEATLDQVSSLYVEQTATLTSYQLNLIRAICEGYHDNFGKREVTSHYDLGSRSNLTKLKQALIDREIAEQTEEGLFLADPLFQIWFKRQMM